MACSDKVANFQAPSLIYIFWYPSLCAVTSHTESGVALWATGYNRKNVFMYETRSLKALKILCLNCEMLLLGGSQLPCLEDTQAALQRGCAEKLRHLPNISSKLPGI